MNLVFVFILLFFHEIGFCEKGFVVKKFFYLESGSG
jgi:hypothetical protein